VTPTRIFPIIAPTAAIVGRDRSNGINPQMIPPVCKKDGVRDRPKDRDARKRQFGSQDAGQKRGDTADHDRGPRIERRLAAPGSVCAAPRPGKERPTSHAHQLEHDVPVEQGEAGHLEPSATIAFLFTIVLSLTAHTDSSARTTWAG